MMQRACARRGEFVRRREFLLYGALGLAMPALAAPPDTRKQGNGPRPWRLLVNEAVTGETNFFVLTNRYKGFAELRRQNVEGIEITHTRYQEAVAQQIKNGFAQVGVVNPTIAKQWAQERGRVIAETQPVVNWSLLASPDVPADACEQLRHAVLVMDRQAPAVMASLGVKEWARADRQDYLALLDYTKE